MLVLYGDMRGGAGTIDLVRPYTAHLATDGKREMVGGCCGYSACSRLRHARARRTPPAISDEGAGALRARLARQMVYLSFYFLRLVGACEWGDEDAGWRGGRFDARGRRRGADGCACRRRTGSDVPGTCGGADWAGGRGQGSTLAVPWHGVAAQKSVYQR